MKKVLLLLTLHIFLFGNEPYNLSNINHSTDLTPYTLYTEDTKPLTAVDIVNSPSLQNLKQGNLGNRPHGGWTRVQIHNNTTTDKNIVIYNPRAGIDKLDIYIYDRNHHLIKTLLTGSVRDLSIKPLSSYVSSFELTVQPQEQFTIVTKVVSSGPLELTWKIVSTDTFFHDQLTSSTIFGLYGGLMFALILYNIGLYVIFREKTFLYYVFFISSISTYQFIYHGALQSFDIFNPIILNTLKFSLAPIGVAFYTLFFISFFETKKHIPWLDATLKFLVTLLFVFAFIDYLTVGQTYFYLLSNLMILMVLVTFLTLLISSFYFLFVYKTVGSHYYIIGELLWIFFGMFQIFVLLGILQTGLLSNFAVIIGMSFDALFLSLALGQKVNYLKKELHSNNEMFLIMSRFTSIGQVIGNISHQWKIPLVRLGSLLAELEFFNTTKDKKANTDLVITQMRSTLDFMSQTINEFQNFYKIDNHKELFNLGNEILEIKNLLEAKLIIIDGNIIVDESCFITLNGHKHSFSHILMVIIDNFIEIAKIRSIRSPYLKIHTAHDTQKSLTIFIEDNCDGIMLEPIETVFDLGLKGEHSKGSGMGLSIVKKIIEHKCQGTINVSNTDKGALFQITLPHEEV